MKKILIFWLLIVNCLISAIAETPSHLVIWSTDGSRITYPLSDEPNITFDNSDMVITAKDIEATHSINSVRQMTYEKEIISSIDKISKDSTSYTLNGDILTVTNIVSDFIVTIYNMDGQTMFNGKYNKCDEAVIPIHNFSSGIYILTVNNNSHKLHLR